MQPVIAVEHLSKRYGDLQAVNDVSFNVPEGVCFGLLGPNGAGKTTTIEILEGLQRPSAGEVRYFGQRLKPRQLYQDIGIQFQHTALQDRLTVRETLRLFSALYARRLPEVELIDLCALAEFADRDTRSLSGGQRQRLLLALALVNDPKIVFLDEPTTGLDPQARHHFWALVDGIKARGKTVLLTTHYMAEAETLCDHIAIMDRGHIVSQGAPQALLAEHFSGALVRMDQVSVPAAVMAEFKGESYEHTLQFQTSRVEDLLAALMAAGVSLHHLQVQAPNLNDLFLLLTGNALRS